MSASEKTNRFLTKSLIIALVCVGILLYIWNYVGNWYRHQLTSEARSAVATALIPKGNALFTTINREFALMNGLVAFVDAHPKNSVLKGEFNTFAAGLLSGRHSIRVVQIFLNEGPVLAYPIEGNEAIIGRRLEDLVNDDRPKVREDVRRAIVRRQVTLSYPYELRQGGLGVVARLAIFNGDEFRGIVSVILDIPAVIENSDIQSLDSGLILALSDGNGVLFWGDGRALKGSPVVSMIMLPEGQWTLAAIPEGGWEKVVSSSNARYRVIGLFIVLVIVVSVFMISARQGRLSAKVREGSTDLREEQSKREQAEKWRQLAVQAVNIGLWDMDLKANRITYSSEWKKQIGYEHHEVSDDFSEWENRVHPDDLERCIETISRYIVDPWPDYNLEFRFRHRDGHYLWILAQASLLYDADHKPVRMLGCHLDITRRKEREESLRKSNRTNTIFSKISRIVQQEPTREMLFMSACRIAVEDGGYPMAWFGMPDPCNNGVTAAGYAGISEDDLHLFLDGHPKNNGPADKAFREGRPIISNDIENDPAASSWRMEALRLEYHSHGAFPLFVNEKVVGILNFYSGEPHFFDDEEIKMVTDLTANISLTLKAMDQEDQRRRAEQALRENEALLNETGRIAKIGGWEFDPVTLEGTWTPEVARIHDLDPEDDTSVEIGLSFFKGKHRQAMERALKEAIERGHPYDLELEMVTAKGNHKWVRSIAIPLMDGNRVVKVRGSFQDISERKLAEITLRDSEERFRTAFEFSASGMCLTGLDGMLMKVNTAMCEMLEYTRKELEGVHFNQITHPEDAEIGHDSIRKMMTGFIPGISFEKRYLTKSGEAVWAQVYTALLRDAMGSPQYFITQLTNITKRKKAEKEIERHNIELEERIRERTAELEGKNKELETFAYSVSHDLKAPLRGIDGYSRLLQEDYGQKLDEEGLTFLNNVRQATVQMNQLIDDLLAYSRIERRTWQVVELDLREMIDTILSSYTDEIANRRITLKIADIPVTVASDPEGVNMVLRNLLANAFKFTREVTSPLIEVGGKETGDSVLLWVRDNGIGFDMAFSDLIFEIFQRLHRSEEYSGTGVGLAIVKKAVERMGGRIRAESEPDKGAVFYFEIPRQS